MLYFFLSHARGEDDIYVQRFFQDLSKEIRDRIRADEQVDVGYVDDTSGTGSRWPLDARVALTTAQTFIALCSAKYFLSDRCGRSWGIFADRLSHHHYSTGRQLTSLVPVKWAGDEALHEALRDPELPLAPHRTPDDEDLRVLIRLQRYRLAYRTFVQSMAHRVVETAHSDRLEPASSGTDIGVAPNEFAAQRQHFSRAMPRRRVFLAVAAGTREQMSRVRTNVQFYGLAREDWAPFQPYFSQSLAAHAQTIVNQRLLESEIVPLEGLADRLAPADQASSDIVVLLVDAWATRVEPLQIALREIFRQGALEFVVLVPASSKDLENMTYQGELLSAVLSTFPESVRRRRLLFWTEIESARTFDDNLSIALTEAQHRLDLANQKKRRPKEIQASQRPILEGP